MVTISDQHIERLGKWPAADEPGRFVARCSCLRWRAIGTVTEINSAARHHDDSPWKHHIVSIYGKVTATAKGDAAAASPPAASPAKGDRP